MEILRPYEKNCTLNLSKETCRLSAKPIEFQPNLLSFSQTYRVSAKPIESLLTDGPDQPQILLMEFYRIRDLLHIENAIYPNCSIFNGIYFNIVCYIL